MKENQRNITPPKNKTMVSERVNEIIKLRFDEKLKLREIGAKFGITRERVRQIISSNTSDGGTGGFISTPPDVIKKCEKCGADFSIRPSLVDYKRFCSQKCFFDSRRIYASSREKNTASQKRWYQKYKDTPEMKERIRIMNKKATQKRRNKKVEEILANRIPVTFP